MRMDRSWLRAVLDDPWLIPVPLNAAGIPDLQTHPIPAHYARDSWLLIAPGNARLHPGLAAILRREARRQPAVSVFYADEFEIRDGGDALAHLKPELDLTLLLSQGYAGSPVLIRLSEFHGLGGFRSEMETAMVYDLLLRAAAAGLCIARIMEILVAYDGQRVQPLPAHRLRAAQDWVADCRPDCEVIPGRAPGSLRLNGKFAAFPAVTILIPTCQAAPQECLNPAGTSPYVVELLDSIAITDWPMDRLIVMIGDDVADDAIYTSRHDPFDLQIIPTPRTPAQDFNYASKMNGMWRQAGSDYLVLMNDDVVVTDPGWLRALMTHAMDETVGGVGARLLFPDGRLQHAGMAGGLWGLCAHPWIFRPADDPTYGDWALVQREWSMVVASGE